MTQGQGGSLPSSTTIDHLVSGAEMAELREKAPAAVNLTKQNLVDLGTNPEATVQALGLTDSDVLVVRGIFAARTPGAEVDFAAAISCCCCTPCCCASAELQPVRTTE